MSRYETRIHLEASDSFDHDLEISNLRDLTILFGKNGTGKSRLLRRWRDSDPESVHYVAPERVGSFNFNPNLIQAELSPNGRAAGSRTNIATHFHDRAIGRVATYFMKRGSVEQPPKSTAAKTIEQVLSVLLPDFAVKLQPDDPPVVIQRKSEEETIVTIDALSSGEAQVLTLAIDILTIAAIWELEDSPKRILLLDEPDTHIHPELQLRLAEMLLETAQTYSVQIVVATHSISLLAACSQLWNLGDVSLVYVRPRKSKLSGRSVDAVHRTLASCLGGHILMGPLFGVPLLLVEGIDDFTLWSQAARHAAVSCAVIPCNGDEIVRHQRRLDDLFSALQDGGAVPIAYALRDGDRSIPQPNPDNEQRFVRFIKLNCHEIENLYLTDEVLSKLEWTWKDAAQEIRKKSSKFGQKEDELMKAPTWDRRNVDLKELIGELATILDPKGVQWKVRLGSILGQACPTGQLADFMGSKVLEALYSTSPHCDCKSSLDCRI